MKINKTALQNSKSVDEVLNTGWWCTGNESLSASSESTTLQRDTTFEMAPRSQMRKGECQ